MNSSSAAAPPANPGLTVAAALQQAIAHHQAGRLPDAERLYRAILQTQPQHPDASHNLGILAIGVGQTEAALPFFKTALEANPQQAQFWLSYADALVRSRQGHAAHQIIALARQRGFDGEALRQIEARLNPAAAEPASTAPPADPLAPAIAEREAGRYRAAATWLDPWLTTHPDDADAHALLAHVLLLDKREDAARAALDRALALAPDLPGVQRNQARLLLKQHQPEAALHAAQRARQSDPHNPESWLVLAAALGASKRDDEALPLVEQALQARPDYAEAWASRALIRLRANDTAGALADAETSLAIKPHLAQLWTLVATLRYQRKNLPGAIEALQKALALEPDDIGHRVNLGEFLRQDTQTDAAIALLQEAVGLAPDNVGAWTNLGAALQASGRIDEARAAYAKALAINPHSAEIASNLGALAKEEESWEDALRYFDQALAIQPDHITILGNRAAALCALGRPEEAEQVARQAIALEPAAIEYAYLAELLLPTIPSSTESIADWRRRYQTGIDTLMALPGKLDDPTKKTHNTNSFDLAYHDTDDRPLMEALCRLFRAKAPALSFTAPHVDGWRPPADGRRIRVGFLSQFLVGHTIGKLYQGLVRHLDRARFEVVLIHAPKTKRDAVSAQLDALADAVLQLPGTLPGQQQMLADEKLDVLFYPDIGMSPTSRFLAFARLAPVQAVSWGHPDTTGIDTLDYFISAAAIEPDEGAAHYSERLVRLSRLPCFYQPLIAPTRIPGRAALGLPETGTLYGCPQSLFKFHPEFDAVLAEIAAGDPDGHVVVLESKVAAWSSLLKERWAATQPILNERVIFLPRVPLDRFMALMAHFDVLLDPIHFGSGNTLYEAMVYGTPIVTWPGRFMRGRIVAGAYRQMKLADAPVAARLADYAPLALALGRDAERRARLRQAFAQGAHELFADLSAVREFEAFLLASVAAAGHGEKLPAGWGPAATSEKAA